MAPSVFLAAMVGDHGPDHVAKKAAKSEPEEISEKVRIAYDLIEQGPFDTRKVSGQEASLPEPGSRVYGGLAMAGSAKATNAGPTATTNEKSILAPAVRPGTRSKKESKSQRSSR